MQLPEKKEQSVRIPAENPLESAEWLLERFGPLVFRLAYARCRSQSDAEDLYQEVFLSWLKNRPVFHDEEHAKAWFLRVTANAANSFWRKPQHKRESAYDEAIDPEGGELRYARVEAEAESTIQRLDLEHCLGELETEDRELIHLFYYEDLRSAQIAEMTGRKESGVRMRLLRARKALKNCLEGRG